MKDPGGMEEKAKPYEEVYFVDTTKPVWNYSLFSDDAIGHFQQGTCYDAYRYFGNHQLSILGTEGTYFSVWAPNATDVSVIGGFNQWRRDAHRLFVRLDRSGIWEGFIPGVGRGEIYKYHICREGGVPLDKGDPFAYYWELKPKTGSVTWNFNYTWQDDHWMSTRHRHNALDAPYSVYEVHLASWKRPNRHDEERYHSYTEIAEQLVPYVKEMGFTHVELMPVMEYPFDGSWGYQGTGYYAPTARFGHPESFMSLIDAFHQAGIGVILDWVPSHFPHDAHGLFLFDGSHTYEYADMRKGYHPDWNSYVFNYGRGEIKSFLISNARFWFDQFHIDGIRVDAVSSMLRLDYSRKQEEWEPNRFGGNGNLEAIAFIKDLNQTIYRDFPDVQTIAEEATDWPGVSSPTWKDGLGFGMKWMMGWMHDTLRYFKQDPIYRTLQQDQFTFSMMYYYDENFMLPLSHDEVVHGKSPMIYKMPGDEWQKFANLRLLYTYMFTHPGGKLLFMGNEFAQTSEWNFKTELDWHLLSFDVHRGVRDCVRDLNLLYKNCKALHERQFEPGGFEWVDLSRRTESIISYLRKGRRNDDLVLIILNMTPVPRYNWKVRVRGRLHWKELFNSNDASYAGTGDVYNPDIAVEVLDVTDTTCELTIHLPPLGALVLG